MRLLLVEDDELLGHGLASGLTQAGFAADWVKTGEDAQAAFETAHYDAAILDIGLPGMDGLSLLRLLRNAKDATPVLILTARDTVTDKIKGLDAGGDDYLVKPFDLTDLARHIDAAR